MVQIIQENRKPSFAEKLNVGVGRGLEEFSKMYQKKQEKKELSEFADKIEKNYPDSPMHKTIADLYRSDLPMEQKSAIVKGLTGIDPFKADQQNRLQRAEVRVAYNQRIKEEQAKLKESFVPEERKSIQARIEHLQRERDEILGYEASDEMEAESPKKKRMKFNPKNKEHIAKFNQLDKEFNGDRKKVNQALSKEFTL